MVILFSTNCPKCKILEQKLNQKGINFEISDDIQEVIDKGFMSAPVLKVDDEYMDFGQGIKWVNAIVEDFDCKSCEV